MMTALQIIELLKLKIWIEYDRDLRYAMVLNSEFDTIHRTRSVDGSYHARSLAYDWIEDNLQPPRWACTLCGGSGWVGHLLDDTMCPMCGGTGKKEE